MTKHDWNTLYSMVLDNGKITSPRGRKTLEMLDVTYSMDQYTHFDPRPSRNISLNYIAREFLWFCKADRYDVRMQEYAPIWKTCIQPDGGINSNYGQYLFAGGWNSPFCLALQHLVQDQDSRRCWIPIFQSEHQAHYEHEDYPCTTGIGFRIRDGSLEMVVHMRSQDMWWGAPNDAAVCYLIQLMAKAYLEAQNVQVWTGDIIHKIDSLHFYERHFNQAQVVAVDYHRRIEINRMVDTCQGGFNGLDLEYLLGRFNLGISNLLAILIDIPGAYGQHDADNDIFE